MSARSTNWSVTINNPIKADEENINLARQKGWSVEGQLEQGDNGTPHYQLIVKTPQMRFSALKKAFPRAHIEIAINVQALENYVKKDDTRIGQLPSQSEFYPSLQKMWDMFAIYFSPDLFTIHPITRERKTILDVFDDFIFDKIAEGYVLETMGVNPQIRSCVKLYYKAIIKRSTIRRQKTDRQTEDNLIPDIDITHNAISNENQNYSQVSEESET